MVGSVDRCSICDGPLRALIDLPSLPLTDTYCSSPDAPPAESFDQEFLYCSSCSHGQLRHVIAPSLLYGDSYGFRTSQSATARKGTAFFLELLNDISADRRFHCALDIGCNDLYLLEQLEGKATHRIGIDPVWRNRESEIEDQDISVIGLGIEEMDWSRLEHKPDLIVCRHVLEHIANPIALFEHLREFAAEDALFVFEVPGLDTLLIRNRFDQIFHQHLQYFSLTSFSKLIGNVGYSYLQHRINYHDWGAMAIAFEKGNASNEILGRAWASETVCERYLDFKSHFQAIGRMLVRLSDEPCVGYGAAQMLPVIAYHLENDLSSLIAIIDDDPEKAGWGYRNLPVKIQGNEYVADWKKCTAIITAPDNARPILNKCVSLGAKNIISIFNNI